MPWYSDWITPPPQVRSVNMQNNRITASISSAWSAGDQNAALSAPQQANSSGNANTATETLSGTTIFQEAGYPAPPTGETVGHGFRFPLLTPNVLTNVNWTPNQSEWQGADYLNVESGSGYVTGYQFILGGSAPENTVVFGHDDIQDQDYAQYGHNGGSIRWDINHDPWPTYAPNPSYKAYPGDEWRSWQGFNVGAGQTVTDFVLDIGPTPVPTAFGAITNWMATIIGTPPNAGGAVPARIYDFVDGTIRAEARFVPNRYQLVYLDDNPPPWMRGGLASHRQRHTPGGVTSGAPTRQRHQGGWTGGAPFRQR